MGTDFDASLSFGYAAPEGESEIEDFIELLSSYSLGWGLRGWTEYKSGLVIYAKGFHYNAYWSAATIVTPESLLDVEEAKANLRRFVIEQPKVAQALGIPEGSEPRWLLTACLS